MKRPDTWSITMPAEVARDLLIHRRPSEYAAELRRWFKARGFRCDGTLDKYPDGSLKMTEDFYSGE